MVNTYKLLLIPLAFLLVFGVIVNLIIPQFDTTAPTEKTDALIGLENVIIGGLPMQNASIGVFWGTIEIGEFASDVYNAIMPNFIQNFLLEQTIILSFLPTWVQTPIIILIIISFSLVLYEVITLLIPG